MQSSYKKDYALSTRVELSTKLRRQHPNRIPIIVDVAAGSNLNLKRTKFLAPADENFSRLIVEIRKHLVLDPSEALFFFCGHVHFVSPGTLLSNVYEKYKDPDGFLYICVSRENTFG